MEGQSSCFRGHDEDLPFDNLPSKATSKEESVPFTTSGSKGVGPNGQQDRRQQRKTSGSNICYPLREPSCSTMKGGATTPTKCIVSNQACRTLVSIVDVYRHRRDYTLVVLVIQCT